MTFSVPCPSCCSYLLTVQWYSLLDICFILMNHLHNLYYLLFFVGVSHLDPLDRVLLKRLSGQWRGHGGPEVKANICAHIHFKCLSWTHFLFLLTVRLGTEFFQQLRGSFRPSSPHPVLNPCLSPLLPWLFYSTLSRNKTFSFKNTQMGQTTYHY